MKLPTTYRPGPTTDSPSSCGRRRLPLLAASTLGFLVGCSGGGGSTAAGAGTPSDSDFAVQSTSIVNGSTWKLNREILIEFTHDVNFETVSQSTIQIIDSQGVPAIGTFTAAGPRTIRFQPRCPTDDAYSNGGFAQGRTYRLTVVEESATGIGGGVTVESTAGERLESGLNVTFLTPTSTDELVLFVDVVAGPPQVRILEEQAEEPTSATAGAYSYMEFGGDPNQVEYFRFDSADNRGEIVSLAPLNLYSDSAQQFALVLKFNQPIVASSTNVNTDMIRLEYYNAMADAWDRVPATVRLLENCSLDGSSVRLEPTGIVPQGATLRVALREGFRDLTGDSVQSMQTTFAVFESTLANPDGAPGEEGDGSDEILEHFVLGGDAAGSLEDAGIASANPRANWGNSHSPGAVSASFDFDGTGGIGGNFDVHIGVGETLIISTDSDLISGGPGTSTSSTQPVINGRLDVRNLTIEEGARLVFTGPNTASILATGEVRINGLISVNGGNNFGVSTLATTNVPEEGAAGQAGGGDGGAASRLTSESTARGEAGEGPFGVPGLGGGGGESTYAPSGACELENRRASGGGGGGFATPVRYDVDGTGAAGLAICQMLVGMDGEPGFPGSFDGTGAESQIASAQGGYLGPQPFVDSSPNNDFYGTMVTASGAQIRGELSTVWAGAGGGGGGDAVTSASFPLTPFTVTGDEKGSGGGGGAGGLLILAIGDIVLEPSGAVTADGGHGGGGENSLHYDRIGGGSGGGSGGHIVMSSAASIIIEAEAVGAATGDFYRDDPTIAIHERRPLSALGGQGGAGRLDKCGAGRNGPSRWRGDAIPVEAFEGRDDIAPNILPLTPAFDTCNAAPMGGACSGLTPAPEGTAFGAGGDGSPGLIQLHVADPDTQLVFGSAATTGYVSTGIDVSRSMAPPPVGWRSPNERPDVLVPFFSSRSESYSRWIPLGLARLNPDGSSNQVEFVFGGTEADGSVPRNGSVGQEMMPVVPYAPLTVGGAAPSIDVVSATLTLPGPSVADPDALYTKNAQLLREFAVRLRNDSDVADEREYTVLSASYDAEADEFYLRVDPRGATLDGDIAELSLASGTLEVELVPFYYRLVAAGVQDAFPIGTDIKILFDATLADPVTGRPSTDPDVAYSARLDAAAMDLEIKNGFAEDINELNGDVVVPGQTNPDELELESVHWGFVRFKVEFDIGDVSGSAALNAPRPGITFLRMAYRF